ncbi:MAG: hypothetical protein GY937_03250 [bacterium]|nr:hypothetical protein [bacterium]
MLLSEGTKLLICHRRLFADDHLRFFFGVVEMYSDGIVKVSGYSWARDQISGFQRKSGRRTKLVAVSSGTLIVYEIPSDVDLEAVRIEQPDIHRVIATDGAAFQMDLAERP